MSGLSFTYVRRRREPAASARDGTLGRRRRRCSGRRLASTASAAVLTLLTLLTPASLTPHVRVGVGVVVHAMPAYPTARSAPFVEPDRTHVLPLAVRGGPYFNFLLEERTGLPVVKDELTGFHTYAVWEDGDNDVGGDDDEEGVGEESDNVFGGGDGGRDEHAQLGHEKLSSHVVSGGTMISSVSVTATAGGAVQRGRSGSGRGGHFRSSGVRVATFEDGVSAAGASHSNPANPTHEELLSSALKNGLSGGARLRTENQLGPQFEMAAETARAAALAQGGGDDDDDAASASGNGGGAHGALQRHSQPLFSTRSFPAGSVRSYDTPEVRSKYRGKFSVMVLLLRFADHAADSDRRPLPPREDYVTLLNNDGRHPSIVPEGSMRDIFLVNSGGLMDVTSVVTEWITLPFNHSHYGVGFGYQTDNLKKGVQWAFQQLEDDPTFSFTDAMGDAAPSKGGGGYISTAVFHSGYAAEWGGTDCLTGDEHTERIWSHAKGMPFESTKEPEMKFHSTGVQSGLWQTCGTAVAHVGVVAHEIAHTLGLPDMIGARPGNGLGNWDMMCNSWGFDASAHYPPILGPHSKIRLGWLEPKRVTRSGLYTLKAAHTSLDALRIDYGFPEGEYLLLENRQPASFDSKMNGANGEGGIAVWHIDETVGWNKVGGHPTMNDIDGVSWPQNGAHYNANLLAADGKYDLEKQRNMGHVDDLWRTLPDDAVVTRVGLTELGPGGIDDDGGPYPNTDTYQGGVVKKTDIRIKDFGAPGDEMSVTILLGDEELATPSPTLRPTPRPTTPRPTLKPTFRPTLQPASIYALRDAYAPLDDVVIVFSNPNAPLAGDWIAVYPASVQELPGGLVPQGVTDWAYACGTKDCDDRTALASEGGTVSLAAVADVVGTAGSGWTPGIEYRAYLCRNSDAPYKIVARSEGTFRLSEAPTARPTPNPTTARPTLNPTHKPTVRPTPSPTTKSPTTARPSSAEPTLRPTPNPTTRAPTAAPPGSSPKPTRRPTVLGEGPADGGDDPTSTTPAPVGQASSTLEPSASPQAEGGLDNRTPDGTGRPSQSLPQETGAPVTAAPAPTPGPTRWPAIRPPVSPEVGGRMSPGSISKQLSWAALGTSLVAIAVSSLLW